MRRYKGWRLLEKTSFFLGGAVIGHLLLHPYAMVAYSLMDMYRDRRFAIHMDHVLSAARSIFDPNMLPMTISFSLLCGLAALLMGLVRDKKNKLHAAALDAARKKAAIETLQRLMITLSHHLLNANTVIGGTAHRCRRHVTDAGLIESLELIGKEAAKIDAVIRALKRITEMKIADYTSEGKGLLIDISKEIEESLSLAEHGSVLKS